MTTSINGSPSSAKFTSAEKRAVHNALERKRRDHIKDMFSQLKDSVPNLAGEKASRAQILKKACDYIQMMRRKNATSIKELHHINQQITRTKKQIAKLESVRNTNRYVANLGCNEEGTNSGESTECTSVMADISPSPPRSLSVQSGPPLTLPVMSLNGPFPSPGIRPSMGFSAGGTTEALHLVNVPLSSMQLHQMHMSRFYLQQQQHQLRPPISSLSPVADSSLPPVTSSPVTVDHTVSTSA